VVSWFDRHLTRSELKPGDTRALSICKGTRDSSHDRDP
jgi:hypothetical protein